jgi:hypothetical protein
MKRCNNPAHWVAKSGMFVCDTCKPMLNAAHFPHAREDVSFGACDNPSETKEQFWDRIAKGLNETSGQNEDWRRVTLD